MVWFRLVWAYAIKRYTESSLTLSLEYGYRWVRSGCEFVWAGMGLAWLYGLVFLALGALQISALRSTCLFVEM